MKFATMSRAFAVALSGVALSLVLMTGDALAAKRLGGGGSLGMQRQSVAAPKQAAPAPTPAPNHAAPAQQPVPSPVAAAPQAQPKRSWMGPLAGLAAGIGLAALASHFGFGEELASMMMIGLVVMGVMMVIGMIMRRRAPAQPAYAGAGAVYSGGGAAEVQQPVAAAYTVPAAGGTTAIAIPADFDVEGFLRHAKVNFIRLQAANDAGNLDDIREFTSPEMFAEIKLAVGERGQSQQETDVVALSAELLDVTEEAQRYVASVHFSGQIREDRAANTEAFAEIWHLTKPRDGRSGWVLAGIQQLSAG